MLLKFSGIEKQLYIPTAVHSIQKKTTLSGRWRREEEEGRTELQISDDSHPLQPRAGMSSSTNSPSSCQNSKKYQ